jgi:hypothetical protein
VLFQRTGHKKQCQYKVVFCIREMADAGNFGGSVPENARGMCHYGKNV